MIWLVWHTVGSQCGSTSENAFFNLNAYAFFFLLINYIDILKYVLNINILQILIKYKYYLKYITN